MCACVFVHTDILNYLKYSRIKSYAYIITPVLKVTIININSLNTILVMDGVFQGEALIETRVQLIRLV